VIQLPPGTWYDYWTGEKLPTKNVMQMKPALDQVPVYVRAGAIVPRQPLVQNTGETPNGPLELRVYAGPDCKGSLYQDDGHSLNYEKGEFLRVNYSARSAQAPSRFRVPSIRMATSRGGPQRSLLFMGWT